jgi:hypothetical protein
MLAGVVVIVGAALAVPRMPSKPAADAPAPDRAQPVVDLAQAPASRAVTPAPAPVAAAAPAALEAVVEPPKKTAAPRVARNQSTSSSSSSKPAAHISATPVTHAAGTGSAVAATAVPAPAAPALASTSIATVEPAPVTITGCLEVSVNADEFRLTDTQGFDAPKSRSWKSGFIKKHSAPVMLVDVADAHAAQAQVGKRVAATGHLAGNELSVSSLRVVGPSCD